jgi:hypothetical protein
VPYVPPSNKKGERATLTGHRNAARKRTSQSESQKKRIEPAEFVASLAEICNPNLDDYEKCFKLIQAHNFDFETYGEAFWEAILTGGIVTSGGGMDDSVVEPCGLNLFDQPIEAIPAISNLAAQVLQRHRHLRPVLDSVLCRIALWVDRYDDERQEKFSNFIVTHCLAHNAGLPVVTTLQQEKRLTESGAAISFACRLFREFLSRASMEKLNRALKDGKAQSIIALLSSSRRTPVHLYKVLEEEGLANLAKWVKTNTRDKRVEDMAEKLEEELADITSLDETLKQVALLKTQYVLGDVEVVVVLFQGIMKLADYQGKKSASKEMTQHLITFYELLEPYCKSITAEKNLIEALLNYVQDDESLFDGFMVTCKELYDVDVLGEDSILAWVEHKTGQGDPEMEPYLNQMAPFIEWLNDADEDSSDEED